MCDIMEYLSFIASKIWLNLSSDFVIYRIQNMAKYELRFSQIMANLSSDLAKLHSRHVLLGIQKIFPGIYHHIWA